MGYRGCNPAGKIIIPLAIVIVLHNLGWSQMSQDNTLLGGYMYRALAPLISMIVSVALGIYSRSPLLGMLALIYLRPSGVEDIVRYQWYFVSALSLGILLAISYLYGPWDSVLEVLTIDSRFHITPLLASTTFTLLLIKLNYINPDFDHWVFVIAGGLLLSKLAVNPIIAIAGGAIASLGTLGTIAIGLYASYAPLPPLSCYGLNIGKLLGYEAITSTTRTVLRTASRRWRTRSIACAHRSNAALLMGQQAILWLYTSKPLELALKIAKANRNSRRILVIDVDKQSETNNVYDIVKTIEESERDIIIGLGGTDTAIREGLLLALSEAIDGRDLLIITSCRESPRSLQKYISMYSKKTLVIASFCKPELEELTPAMGPEGSGIVLASIGDPLLTATILGKLFPDNWKPIDRLLRMNPRIGLAYAYCNNGWALIEIGV